MKIIQINGVSLPTVSPTEKQPTEDILLTAWVLSKINLLRPSKIIDIQAQYEPKRLLQFNQHSRPGRLASTQLDLTRNQNIHAVLIYIYGTKCDEPCIRCAKRSGVFNGCYTFGNLGVGACANCIYSSRGKSCSHHCMYANMDDILLVLIYLY